jgi:F-type H+-transporting ATPase subunit epsilon
MRLRVFEPSEVFLDTIVNRVVGESPAGSFGILPRHVDMATALVTGILSYETEQGEEKFLALDGGILIKRGDVISIATRRAIKGELGALRETVEKILEEVDERERETRAAVAKLEANFIRRFVEFGKNV